MTLTKMFSLGGALPARGAHRGLQRVQPDPLGQPRPEPLELQLRQGHPQARGRQRPRDPDRHPVHLLASRGAGAGRGPLRHHLLPAPSFHDSLTARPPPTRAGTCGRALPPAASIVAACLALFASPVSTQTPPPAVSVSAGADGRLRYSSDAQGNRIVDFSHAGYGGGGVRLPDVPARIVVGPGGGRDGTRIQAAIDLVSSMTPDANGFRGAVLLEAGRYTIDADLRIAASGVVLRGSGAGEAGTVLTAAGTSRRSLIVVSGDQTPPGSASVTSDGVAVDIPGRPHPVVDSYVPTGATEFTLADTVDLKPGDRVVVRRPSTASWIALLGMNLFQGWRPENRLHWQPGSRDIEWDRVVTAVRGDRLTVDAPLTTALDERFGGASVLPISGRTRLRQVGDREPAARLRIRRIAADGRGPLVVRDQPRQRGERLGPPRGGASFRRVGHQRGIAHQVAHRRGRGRACAGVRAGRLPPPRLLHGRPADAVPPLPQRARPPRLRRRVRRRRAERVSRELGARRARVQRPDRELGVRRALRQRRHPRQRAAAHQPRHRRPGRRLGRCQLRPVEQRGDRRRGAEPARRREPGLRLQGARDGRRRRLGSAHDAVPRLLPRLAGGAAQPLPRAAGRTAWPGGRRGDCAARDRDLVGRSPPAHREGCRRLRRQAPGRFGLSRPSR